MALIFYKTPQDATLILGTRESLIYPFTAAGWRDLRLGFYLSVTNSVDDDVLTSLTEDKPRATSTDRFFMGFKNNVDAAPRTVGAGVSFLGITNEKTGADATHGQVNPSTGGVTTTGATYWRAHLAGGSASMRGISTSDAYMGGSADFALTNNPVGSGLFLNQGAAAGYAALSIVRMVKVDTGTESAATVNIEGGSLVNLDYTNTPTIERIRSFLATGTFVQSATMELGAMPDAVYFYWPFSLSRLRIHAIVLEKFA